jgi:tetratricopeptide (TPR) repeat protein
MQLCNLEDAPPSRPCSGGGLWLLLLWVFRLAERMRQDECMSLVHWRAASLAVGLASVGAAIAYVLAGGGWAVWGAVIGAVTGSFAPSMYDALRERDAGQEHWMALIDNGPPQSWARLLDPQREVVGFVGRERELAALTAWCEDDDAGRLRLVTGAGGVGKTRLAVELSGRLKELGWNCERVKDGTEAGAIDALRRVTRSRTLLIVDYAETRTGLPQMLAALASDKGDGVRVLLLARSGGDWWDQVGVGDSTVWDLVEAARQASFSLSPVVASQISDAEIVAIAVGSFARELSLPGRDVVIYGDSGPGKQRVLDLHAAALVAVLSDTRTGPVQVDIRTVLGELLRHEQHFWYLTARARGLPDGWHGSTTRVLRQLVAAACLLGAATDDEAFRLASRVPGISPSAKIAEWLRSLYPPDPEHTDWIGSVQPDRLAELHVMLELAASPELAQQCLTNLNARQALRAVTLLARASSDYPEAETLLSETLPVVAEVIADMQAPAETLNAIFNAIPYPTVVLAPAAVTIGQQITSHLPADVSQPIRAYWLDILGVRLAALGRPGEALAVTEEAVAIRRELAAADPDRHSPILAGGLTNLGAWLSQLDRVADALVVTEEAVAIRRGLADAHPDLYRLELADSLLNLGVWLSELGRPAEALPVTEEAVAVYRELAPAATDSERYRSNLASSLSNLGVRFSELGRPAEALPVAEEAVAIRRELVAVNPDRWRPDLAHSLASLGTRFSKLGRPADALPVTEEAVAIRRELAAANPDLYRRDLARSLTDLSEILTIVGRNPEADAARRESMRL